MEVDTNFVWSAIHERWAGPGVDGAPAFQVGIVLWPEFTLTALAGFVDAMRLAADVGDRSKQVRCRWLVMSVDGHPVQASCGLPLTPNAGLRDPKAFDYIVVVSGLVNGIRTAPRRLEGYVTEAAAVGIPLVGICTGGIVLAKAGLMKGKRCCVASFHVGDLEELGSGAIPVYDRLFLDEGDRITCGGGVASIDLASYLVERHCGSDRVVKLIDRLLADRPRPAAHAPYRSWLDFQTIRDVRVRRALIIMEQNLSTPVTIATLSERLNTSERHLERMFVASFGKSPARIYRTLRLRYGEWLLLNTEQAITSIAFECGFADASHFSRQFQAEFNATPTAVRQQAALRQARL